jgi:hypothetical protein
MKSTIIETQIYPLKLDKDIQFFTATNECKPYLFMSKDTCLSLSNAMEIPFIKEANRISIDKEALQLKDSLLAKYKGHKIIIDDDIPFGEVDIR